MDRRIRVLFIVSYPTTTPAITVHADLMRHLDRDRVDVHVAYNRLAAVEPHRSSGSSVLDAMPGEPDIHLRPTEFGPVGNATRAQVAAGAVRALLPGLRDAAALVRYVRHHGIDVIHCEEGIRNGPYALALSRLTSAKYVPHFHLTYGTWMSPASRAALRRADAVISVSDWTGRGLKDGGVPADRIFPVLNGIRASAFEPGGADGHAARRELGMGPDDPLVLIAAQLVEWKRQHVLIEAFRPLAARHPTARLVLAGAEVNPSGVYTKRLHRLVAEFDLADQVVFTGFRRDVRSLFAAADVFALPSVGEPFGLVLAEAMAMGKPVVGVDAGGITEVGVHGETGLLGPADDVGTLTANLQTLLDDPQLRATMGASGRTRATHLFDARRMADDVEAVYRLVCGFESEPAHS
jgi:glycosyltransferase involved in cell wall biosynthesis